MTITMKQWLPAAALTMMIAGATAVLAQAPASEPQAPKPQGPVVATNEFPPVNPKNFTAASPTAAEVNSFLKSIWGYDGNRAWEVAAILKTQAPGVSKVVVFVSEAGQAGGPKTTVFFTTPDGKHAIADQVIDFGAKPFEANRETLVTRANGAAKGATSKDLELVEFADLECPHCKEAQGTMAQLAKDFPEARIVFENYPIAEIHPFAYRAAAEGVCVRKAKGDAAFFTYASTVYDKQAGLTKESVDATLAAAVTAAGADPNAVAACANDAATKQDVDASIQLGKDVGVDQTPLLFVNGHALPITALPYETLKKIVIFQAGQDGISVHPPPTLTSLQ
ncbi:thioredoxin domain-containing protein [Granulicella sp. 5B5]|uniref:DsbA family protein n=1 Tax=Granulicella sp. 5B5 TaxID=1617967 RepID=UPI0021061C19|nr:thioredoxin domain-containing protein [Granulicella sp. 5B5]